MILCVGRVDFKSEQPMRSGRDFKHNQSDAHITNGAHFKKSKQPLLALRATRLTEWAALSLDLDLSAVSFVITILTKL